MSQGTHLRTPPEVTMTETEKLNAALRALLLARDWLAMLPDTLPERRQLGDLHTELTRRRDAAPSAVNILHDSENSC